MKWFWAILLVVCALVVLVAKTLPPKAKAHTKSIVSPSTQVIENFTIDCRQGCESILSMTNDGRMIILCNCPDAGLE